MNFFCALHQILKKHPEAKILWNGIDEEPFHMRTCIVFKPIRVPCLLAMEQSNKRGANLPRKKSTTISLSSKKTILNHAYTSKNHSWGLQHRVGYYLLRRFRIRAGEELWKLLQIDFKFGVDEAGRFMCYNESLSKNCKVNVDNYQEEHFWSLVKVHNFT